jgi:hypothetical protein
MQNKPSMPTTGKLRERFSFWGEEKRNDNNRHFSTGDAVPQSPNQDSLIFWGTAEFGR